MEIRKYKNDATDLKGKLEILTDEVLENVYKRFLNYWFYKLLKFRFRLKKRKFRI